MGRGRNKHTNGRTKDPLCFTELRPLQDHCPKLENCLIPQTFVLTSKAGDTAAPVAEEWAGALIKNFTRAFGRNSELKKAQKCR